MPAEPYGTRLLANAKVAYKRVYERIYKLFYKSPFRKRSESTTDPEPAVGYRCVAI